MGDRVGHFANREIADSVSERNLKDSVRKAKCQA